MNDFMVPSEAEVKAAIRQLTTFQLRRAFFERLENPLWLEPLAREGMFDNPPSAETVDDGLARDTYWPEMVYLERVAAQVPISVVDVLVKIGTTQNVWFQRAMFAIGAKVPADQASRLVKHLKPIAQLDLGWRVDPRDVTTVIVNLLKSDEHAAGLKLATAAYRPRPSEEPTKSFGNKPRLVFDEHWYAQAIPQVAAALWPGDLPTIYSWLVAWEKYSGHLADEHDTTSFTREAIRKRGGFGEHEPAAQVLIEGTRDLAARAAVADPSVAVTALLRVKMELGQRIALYSLSEALKGEGFSSNQLQVLMDAAVGLLADTKSEQDRCRIEYGELARAVAARDQSRLQGVFDWVMAGPFSDDDELRTYFHSNDDDGDEIVEQRVADYSGRWRHKWLAAIGVNALSPDLQAVLKVLDSRWGVIEHPLEPSNGVISWTGPNPPISQDEMSLMSPLELVTHLADWHTSGDGWGPEPTHEGQGRALTEVITGNPMAVNGVDDIVERLRPTYLRAILQGWSQALRADLLIPWNQVDEVTRGVLEHDDALTFPQEGRQFDDDGDFRWAKKAAVELLEEMIKPRDRAVVPPDLLANYADLLIAAGFDGGAWKQYEEYDQETGMDPLTTTLNWEWPRRLRGLVSLMAHGQETAWYEVAKRALETELARDDRRGASRAVIGESIGRFLNVDEEWAKSKVPVWFGGTGGLTSGQQIALSTTLALYHYYRGLYQILAPAMLAAIQLDEPVVEGFRGDSNALERIGQWAINGIILGDLTVEDPVAAAFFAQASPEVRGKAIGHFPWSFSQWDRVDDDLRRRLEQLWDQRLKHVRNYAQDSRELDEFFWFVKSGKFNPAWWLPRLKEVIQLDESFATSHLAMGKELALAATKSPRDALDIAKLLLASDRRPGGSSSELRQYAIHFIIAEAMLSDDQSLEEDARALMNQLGSEGDLELAAKVDKAKSREISARDIPF